MKSVTHVAGQLCYPCSRLHPLVCAQRASEASGLEFLRRHASMRGSSILTRHTHDQPHVPDFAVAAHRNLVKRKRLRRTLRLRPIPVDDSASLLRPRRCAALLLRTTGEPPLVLQGALSPRPASTCAPG